MTQISTDLYQLTYVMEPIKLSMHQYLLLSDEPILVQTGSAAHAKSTLPQIGQLLDGRPLTYILVSHFESDECGGLSLVLESYPQAVVLCSEVTARQLTGFGITDRFRIMKPGETLGGEGFELACISYPSEMHMWEGLLFIEKKRGIFFSSDLMFATGENHGQVVQKSWEDAVRSSGADLLPATGLRGKLIEDLLSLDTRFVASGHGPCIRIGAGD